MSVRKYIEFNGDPYKGAIEICQFFLYIVSPIEKKYQISK